MGTKKPPTPDTDTICAIATPLGVGGIGIIRVSGPLCTTIAEQLLDVTLTPRRVFFARFLDDHGSTIDSGVALLFAAPASFTGEDVLELQAHGGPLILQLLMTRVLELGARPARPGEFSERAFLNNKLDLAQAEAIADLIESGTEAAARAAQRSLEGVFSNRVNLLLAELTSLRVFIEASLDFAEEEIDFLADSDTHQRLEQTIQTTRLLLDEARQGRLLRDGITIAIVGPPNVGKSSLLNILAGTDTAIVTDIPGTTRDVLRESISIEGIPVHFADTAGLRDATDVIEAEGVKRARAAVEGSDLVLLVLDLSDPGDSAQRRALELPPGIRCIQVWNKMDIAAGHNTDQVNQVNISAKTGEGIETLKTMIRDAAGLSASHEGVFSARKRHLDALRRTQQHLQTGKTQLGEHAAPELLAEELRFAHKALGEITGAFLPDELLGAIFASFCIGK